MDKMDFTRQCIEMEEKLLEFFHQNSCSDRVCVAVMIEVLKEYAVFSDNPGEAWRQICMHFQEYRR